MAKSYPTIKIVNLETGEEIEREMTSEELSDYEARKKEIEAKRSEELATQAARQSAIEKLAALGLTEAEIQALAG